MIKLAFCSIWSCLITVLAIAGGAFLFGNHDQSTEAKDPKKTVVYTTPQQLVAPIVHDDKVHGYLFSTAVIEIFDGPDMPVSDRLSDLMQDRFLAVVMGTPSFIIPVSKTLDISMLKVKLRDELNALLKGNPVRAVFVINVNFLRPKEARGKVELRTVWLQEKPKNERVQKKPKKADKASH